MLAVDRAFVAARFPREHRYVSSLSLKCPHVFHIHYTLLYSIGIINKSNSLNGMVSYTNYWMEKNNRLPKTRLKREETKKKQLTLLAHINKVIVSSKWI